MRSGVMRTRSELATETGAPFPGQHSTPSQPPEVIRQRKHPLPPRKTHLHANDVRVHLIIGYLMQSQKAANSRWNAEGVRYPAYVTCRRAHLQAGDELMSFQNLSNQLILMRLD